MEDKLGTPKSNEWRTPTDRFIGFNTFDRHYIFLPDQIPVRETVMNPDTVRKELERRDAEIVSLQESNALFADIIAAKNKEIAKYKSVLEKQDTSRWEPGLRD